MTGLEAAGLTTDTIAFWDPPSLKSLSFYVFKIFKTNLKHNKFEPPNIGKPSKRKVYPKNVLVLKKNPKPNVKNVTLHFTMDNFILIKNKT